MTEQEKRLAKEAQRKWAREYRKENPEKIKAANERYWLRRALREQEAAKKEDEHGTEQ